MIDLDSKIAELKTAVEGLRQKWKENGYNTDDLKRLKATEKELEETMAKRAEAETGERFKNIEQAAAWIIGTGFIVSPRTVRNHAEKAGFPRKQKDGSYLKNEIGAYAAANWENPSKPADPEELTAGNANDRLKIALAEDRELRNKKTKGELIDAAEEEARDAALWGAIRSEVENQAPGVINDLVESILALDPPEDLRQRIVSLIPALRDRHEDRIAEIFDRFARDGGVEISL